MDLNPRSNPIFVLDLRIFHSADPILNKSDEAEGKEEELGHSETGSAAGRIVSSTLVCRFVFIAKKNR